MFTALNSDAILPNSGNLYDAGNDLHLSDEVVLPPQAITIATIPINLELKEVHLSGLILGKSTTPHHQVIVLPGVVNSNYKGPLRVMLFNFGNDTVRIQRGEVIAQLLIINREKRVKNYKKCGKSSKKRCQVEESNEEDEEVMVIKKRKDENGDKL